jgi:AbrB family looped-hinge helix DNA binding protein
MKRYPKILQIDKRGQIVIPKDIRQELNITEGTGFYAFTITQEGILLKKVEPMTLDDSKEIIEELKQNAKKTNIKRHNIERSIKEYKNKPTTNKLEEV